MIHVMATVEVKPGEREALLADLARLAPQIQSEKGCLDYVATTDYPTAIPEQAPPRGNVIVTVERWQSLRDCEAHLTAPHMRAFLERHRERILSARLQILQNYGGPRI